MNRFKRLTALLLALVMSVGILAGCGDTIDETQTTTPAATTEVTTEAPVTTAPATTTEPAATTVPVTTAPLVTTTEATTTEQVTTSAVDDEMQFTVEEMSAKMYATDAVNVRSGPSADYDRIGGLQPGDEAIVTGRASTGWYRINYDGKVGYVSNAYLSDKAPSDVPSSDDDEDVTIDEGNGDDEDITIDEDDNTGNTGTVAYGDWAEDNGWEYMLSAMNDDRYITVINQIAQGMQNLETEIFVEPIITEDEAYDFTQLILPLIAVEYCYVDRVTSVTTYSNTGILKSVKVDYYVDTKAEADKMVSELRSAANDVLSGVRSSWSDYQKIQYIHDWIVLNSAPDANNIGGPHASNAYGAIVDGTPTCLGYAKALFYLLSKEGFDTTFGVGLGTTAKHIWVKVKAGSEWYNIVVTWDDPVTPTAADPDLVYYDYFMVTDEFMERSHADVYDMRFFREPSATSLRYNWHNVNDYYATSMSEAEDIIEQATRDAVNEGGEFGYARIKFSSQSLYQQFSDKYSRSNYSSEILEPITSRYTCSNKYLGSTTWTLTYKLVKD